MIFTVSKIEQVVHPTDGLDNPQNTGNPMILGIYRTRSHLPLVTVNSKKAYGEFWDTVVNKKIPKRLWTNEMKAFERQKTATAPQPPFIFKVTILGWVFVMLVVAMFGFMVYETLKPDTPKPAEYVAMEQAPVAGDIFFGRYEAYREKNNPIGADTGFGWFKVIKVNGEEYHLVKSTDMSKKHLPKEQLGNIDFETVPMVPMRIPEQTGYAIRFQSADGLTEVYITDKK